MNTKSLYWKNSEAAQIDRLENCLNTQRSPVSTELSITVQTDSTELVYDPIGASLFDLCPIYQQVFSTCEYLSSPTLSVQAPILYRLGKMFRFYVIAAGEVGYGAGYFEDTVVGTGREVKPVHSGFE